MPTALHELTGSAELCVSDTSTTSAIRLLDHLLDTAPGSKSPARAKQLSVWERDQLLARTYVDAFGGKLDSTVDCLYCDNPFDLDFRLDELVDFIGANRDETAVAERSGDSLLLMDGSRVRLPTGEDEQAVSGLPPETASVEILKRCLQDGPATNMSYIEEVMERVAPMIQANMLARCPECGRDQEVHFDMQSFLLNRLLLERPAVLRDVHLLARTYHWSHRDILDLPRRLRRHYATLIEAEHY